MTSPQTTILLLGAGELGTAFLPHLSALPNTHITIGIRSPSKYTHLQSPNISLTAIDLSSPSPSLAKIFSAYDILISATGFGADPSSVLKLAEEALLAGKIRKEQGKGKFWFFPWQWGVDYDVIGDGEGMMPLFGAQRDVRNLLREKADESNVKWTVVSTGIFMSFLFEQFWGIVDRSKEEEGKVVVRCLKDWDHKVTVTDVNDIGRVLARIIAGDVEAEDRVLYIAGDTISYGQLVDIVKRVSGKQVEQETWSLEHLKKELDLAPEDGIKKYRLVFARDGVWWEMGKTVNKALGMDVMDVETFTRSLFSR
ncbi:uncharacterized protein J4E84_006312 [Alternaria hordeiaustralica]|uniref:uncharacterized protein n=1 Tax=Alternaria hordeiaustralica TaxID=1187925 RepID=UPI0020C1CE6F|nr:uncharacterized protein J4E84_006312 [Alternaria hordeiaustralica]KAI4684324.1 hypothetical protein J4E84_006312 [Alternaria hordeiaustralica]